MQSQGQALQGALDKLPMGFAWTRQPDSNWGRLLTPLAWEGVLFEEAAEAQLDEAIPSGSLHLLPDYERVLGPDPCMAPDPADPDARRRAVHSRWTGRQGASRQDYIALAATCGFDVVIDEFAPAVAGGPGPGRRPGALVAGGLLYGPAWRWTWRLTVTPAVDFQNLPAAVASLSCTIRRTMPAHTTLILVVQDNNFSPDEFGSDFAGGTA